MKMLQFELWKDCSNNCSFCWNRDFIHLITPKQEKINHINYVLEKLNEDISEYNVISIIGGEFFEGQIKEPEVKEAFLKLIYKFVELLKYWKIEQVFIMLSLMREDESDLDEIIEIFKNEGVLNRVLWCTSYDEEGRFHTEQQRQIWFNNIERYKNNYLRIHVEMIMTEPMIQAILNEKVKLDYFLEHNVSVDFIRPRVHTSITHKDKTKEETLNICSFIYPKRSTFLTFLSYLQEKYPNKFSGKFATFLDMCE